MVIPLFQSHLSPFLEPPVSCFRARISRLSKRSSWFSFEQRTPSWGSGFLRTLPTVYRGEQRLRRPIHRARGTGGHFRGAAWGCFLLINTASAPEGIPAVKRRSGACERRHSRGYSTPRRNLRHLFHIFSPEPPRLVARGEGAPSGRWAALCPGLCKKKPGAPEGVPALGQEPRVCVA